jgi:hypothetical protein
VVGRCSRLHTGNVIVAGIVTVKKGVRPGRVDFWHPVNLPECLSAAIVEHKTASGVAVVRGHESRVSWIMRRIAVAGKSS